MSQQVFKNGLRVDGQLTACRVQMAERFGARLRGLLFRPPLALPQALLIRPCNSVHTFWMGYALDVVFLDRDGQVLRVRAHLKPWRAASLHPAHAVLELAAGGAATWGIRPGSRLGFETFPPRPG